jgi:hypothetical protein
MPKVFWKLSTTDRRSLPFKIYLNEDNWAKIPSTSDYKSLGAYRTALVSHEIAHALGHDHVSCRSKGAPSDVRQQPSLPLHGCKPTTKVVFHNKSPKRPDII